MTDRARVSDESDVVVGCTPVDTFLKTLDICRSLQMPAIPRRIPPASDLPHHLH